ncbi:MAG: oligosaccharide flippase family protein [Bacteroidales bacterium]|nr:oligosaccharide flippase family protein [Bacteroidales bacterium]
MKTKNLIKYFTAKINSGYSRSVKAKKNILLSISVKGSSMALTFIMLPILIHYLGKTQYGIWVTIGSLIEWGSFFDLGMGQGLRNRLAEAWAKEKKKIARIYISTTYTLLFLIIAAFMVIFTIAEQFINWQSVFNTTPEIGQDLSLVMIIVTSMFAVRFVLRIMYVILQADQMPGVVDTLKFTSKLISFITILILTTLLKDGSLLEVALAFSISPVLTVAIASLFFFTSKYKEYRPSLKFIDFRYSGDILNLGFRFFIIQLAVIVMFSTDSIIITQLFGPAEVTPYQVARKYFDIILVSFSLLMGPFWSAFTEAWTKKDIQWIRNIIRKLNKIWLYFVLASALMITFSGLAYRVWVGSEVKVPFDLTLIMGVYVIVRIYGSIYNNFINGVGKIKLQFIFSIGSALLNIPLSVFFAKTLGMGISGVILATLVCILYGPVIAPLQYKLLINHKARGIWNK